MAVPTQGPPGPEAPTPVRNVQQRPRLRRSIAGLRCERRACAKPQTPSGGPRPGAAPEQAGNLIYRLRPLSHEWEPTERPSRG